MGRIMDGKSGELKNPFVFMACCFILSCGMIAVSTETGYSLPDSGGSEDTYVLRKGDRIGIKIYPDDEYIKGGEMEISSEGNITLSYIGKIEVAEKTVIDAEKTIATLLATDYLVDPEVVIEVLEYTERSFVVLGSVEKPGTYNFPEGKTRLTLLQAMSMAGGFSNVANMKKIKVVRKNTGQVIRVNGEAIIKGEDADIELQSNDVIHVSESLF